MPDRKYDGFSKHVFGAVVQTGAGWVYPFKRDARGVGPVQGNISVTADSVFVRGFRNDGANCPEHESVVDAMFPRNKVAVFFSDKPKWGV